MFKNKKILLGISASIAAYKAAILASKLVQQGAEVQVLLTPKANNFIGAHTFSGLTGRRPLSDFFADDSSRDHIGLGQWADLMIISPATADIIAKLAGGIADDVISTTAMSMPGPILVAPAMNERMFLNPATQANIKLLGARGYQVIWPEEGFLACGDKGTGRLAATEVLLESIKENLELMTDLSGSKILITSGPTQEAIDSVRYLSNYSSGKMGHALSSSAVRAKAKVILVTGPTSLPDPYGAEVYKIRSATEMLDRVSAEFSQCDIFIMAAAVSDYRPEKVISGKIKKDGLDKIDLKLIANPDILKEISKQKNGQFTVGFAAESQKLEENALKKLNEKKLDLIIANNITLPGQGFGSDFNSVLITDGHEIRVEIENKTKSFIARNILKILADKISKGSTG